MSDLIQPIKDGMVEDAKTSNKSTKASNDSLGKEAFLQLLCTQMQYQDPLNPSTDTEYVAQLATFSQLEQMQNISTVTTNSQALTLVGKNIVLKTEAASGKVNYLSGVVDFVNISGGNTKLSVNGKLYDMDQLYSVVDETYLISQGLPSIEKEASLTYNLKEPKDLEFEVKMGSGETTADNVAILINGDLLDSQYVLVGDSKVTINKEVFKDFGIGKYAIGVVFNDPYYTTVTDKVSVQVVDKDV